MQSFEIAVANYWHQLLKGQYTTRNGDGKFKQYRGSGKPYGNIPRPNVKETQNNPSPSGHRPGKPKVRRPMPDEIPKG